MTTTTMNRAATIIRDHVLAEYHGEPMTRAAIVRGTDLKAKCNGAAIKTGFEQLVAAGILTAVADGYELRAMPAYSHLMDAPTAAEQREMDTASATITELFPDGVPAADDPAPVADDAVAAPKIDDLVAVVDTALRGLNVKADAYQAILEAAHVHALPENGELDAFVATCMDSASQHNRNRILIADVKAALAVNAGDAPDAPATTRTRKPCGWTPEGDRMMARFAKATSLADATVQALRQACEDRAAATNAGEIGTAVVGAVLTEAAQANGKAAAAVAVLPPVVLAVREAVMAAISAAGKPMTRPEAVIAAAQTKRGGTTLKAAFATLVAEGALILDGKMYAVATATAPAADAKAQVMALQDALVVAKQQAAAGAISHDALRAAGEALLMARNDALVAAGKKAQPITSRRISDVIR